jgi:16S rRNA (adenine1518-N6/adenine1519-N6)-dimethyltransferase
MLKLSNKLQQLPKTQEVIKKYNLTPNKKLGQNFLLDFFITDKIVLSHGNLSDVEILEVGPGPGTLTRSLLASQAKKIFAIEMDERCIKFLNDLAALSDDRLVIIQGDALKLDESSLTSDKLVVIANLPYNIGTNLILKWLENISLFKSITVMLQKEVAERICATPSSKEYGRLSIISQLYCDTEILFDVAPENFFPPPKVTSSILRLIPLAKPRYEFNKDHLEKIVRTAFAMRRKVIKTALKPIFGSNIDSILSKTNIDPMSRAENISIEAYCKLSTLV